MQITEIVELHKNETLCVCFSWNTHALPTCLLLNFEIMRKENQDQSSAIEQ
jgi:hypothetical protein